MNFISKSSVILLFVSAISVFNPEMSSFANAANFDAIPALHQLFQSRYHNEIQRSQTTSANGIPGPLFLKNYLITDPEYVTLINNFEAHPEMLYENPRLLRMVTHDAVRDYQHNQFSRQIVDTCLTVCPDKFFVAELFKAAVSKRVDQVVEMIIENAIYRNALKESADSYFVTEVAVLMADQGNYDLAYELVRKNVVGNLSSLMLSIFIKSAQSETDLNKAEKFLNFLIHEMRDPIACSHKHQFEASIKQKLVEAELAGDIKNYREDDETSKAEKIFVH